MAKKNVQGTGRIDTVNAGERVRSATCMAMVKGQRPKIEKNNLSGDNYFVAGQHK